MPTASDRRSHVAQTIIPQLDVRPFIGGKFADPAGEELHAVLDPMTEETLAEVPLASIKDAEAAVSAASDAFYDGEWRDVHPRQRVACLLRLADLIDRHADELALLEAADTGKPLSGVKAWDIPNAAEVYRYYAGWADKIVGDALPAIGTISVEVRREPVGVAAAIIPWNFPFPNMAWKLGPALAAGCTVVVKPAERAPMSAYYLARLMSEADFPDGVVNFVMGPGETVGAALVADPRIAKVTFTGDTHTGREIIAKAGQRFPRVTMELGGKSANVVLPDADLEAAVPGAVTAMLSVQGQDCAAGSRTFVHESIIDEFLEGLCKLVEARRLGDPLDDSTQQGPQIDRRHLERIAEYVNTATSQGATCATGGRVGDIGGLFYLPTVITNTRDDMRIMREEVFGPVGCVAPFKTLDEAIQRANASDFGLAAAVWTRTPSSAERFARECRAGTCWVNCYAMFDTTAPWGGIKASGLGRELGREGIDGFLEPKTIFRAVTH